jgi:hypothetical protein
MLAGLFFIEHLKQVPFGGSQQEYEVTFKMHLT